MRCANCGREIMQETAVFCPYCRKKVERRELEEGGAVYQFEVKGLLKSGKLMVYRDRTEFVSSRVQKAIFSYEGLAAVEKGLDRIYFITGDGKKESCPADRKCVHEAFIRIEEMSGPYIDRRKEELRTLGVRYSFPTRQGPLNDGVLEVSESQAEFKRAGKREVIFFRDVKSVGMVRGYLDFTLFGKGTKSFPVSEELQGEVLDFVSEAIKPYLEKREEELRDRGISLSSVGPDGVATNFFADRVEREGQAEAVFFRNVRTAGLYEGSLELALTDGTQRRFALDTGDEEKALSLVGEAIGPYVEARKVGFDTSFGVDERIEINEARGVFHIIRQRGREITDECPLDALTQCRWEEGKELNALGSAVSSGIALLNRVAGNQTAGQTEDRPSRAGVVLELAAEQKAWSESIWFGLFPVGVGRTDKKYGQCLAEWSRFSNYLRVHCPACEQIVPAGLGLEGGTSAEAGAAADPDIMEQVDAVLRFIVDCAPPTTIALKESQGGGEESALKILYRRLEGSYPCRWFDAWQLLQRESKEGLSIQVGKALVGLLSGEGRAVGKGQTEDALIAASGVLTGMFFNAPFIGETATSRALGRHSTEQLAEQFVRKVGALAQGETGRVVLFIDGLDRLSPAKAVELLDAMGPFFPCKGCVFVISIDPGIVNGYNNQQYGPEYAEKFHRQRFKEVFDIRPSDS